MALSKQAREERNRYNREWAQNNPEKKKSTRDLYWERKAFKRKQEEEAEKDV